MFLFPGFIDAQDINIPQNNFLLALIEDSVDVHMDGKIQVEEALLVDTLDIAKEGDFDLTGIERFTNLQYLNCRENYLYFLSVDNLTQLTYLDCFANDLTQIDLPDNNQLVYLNFRANDVATIDLTNQRNLKTLICSANELTKLDIQLFPDLEYLDCWFNTIDTLNLSGLSLSLNKISGINNSAGSKSRPKAIEAFYACN